MKTLAYSQLKHEDNVAILAGNLKEFYALDNSQFVRHYRAGRITHLSLYDNKAVEVFYDRNETRTVKNGNEFLYAVFKLGEICDRSPEDTYRKMNDHYLVKDIAPGTKQCTSISDTKYYDCTFTKDCIYYFKISSYPTISEGYKYLIFDGPNFRCSMNAKEFEKYFKE